MPWRQQQLQQRWRRWSLLAASLLLLLVCGFQHGYWQYQLNQQRENGLTLWPAALRSVAALHVRTLATQKQVLQQQQRLQVRIQRQRDLARWLVFMQLLSTEIPANIWLSSLKKEQENIAMQGFSHSVAALHRLRERLYQYPEVRTANLGALRRESSGDVSFTMRISLKNGEQGEE